MVEIEGYKLKYKRSTRGLDTVQAVYAVVMALGLREIFVGSHDFISAIIYGSIEKRSVTFIVSMLLLLNVIFLGIRFFWVPRNLRRIIAVAAFNSEGTPSLDRLGSAYISLNWLIVFFHAGLYFTLCTEFKFIMFSLTSNAVAHPSTFSGYFLGHIFLLTINGLWIGSLASVENKIATNKNAASDQDTHAGIIWFRNNLAFSLLAIAPFALIGNCQSDHFECVAHLGINSNGLEGIIATSGVMISSVFSLLALLIAPFGIEPIYNISLWVLLCFLLNSLIDLLTTGSNYIVLEEVEWEGELKARKPTGRPQP